MLLTTADPAQRRLDFTHRNADDAGAWVQRQATIDGATVEVELWCADRRHGQAAASAVIDELQRIDRATNPRHADSELCRINHDAARRPVRLTAEMCGLIDGALGWSQRTRGAFDISRRRDADGTSGTSGISGDSGRRSDAASSLPGGAGWQHVLLDREARTLRFAVDGLVIALGGYARGYAADRAAALLRRRGIVHARVATGGHSRCIGDRRGRPWTVAVRDPRHEDAVVAALPLEDAAFAQALGDGRGRGEGAGHGSPDTAKAGNALGVTVLAADGLAAAALMQAVLALGIAAGLALVESLCDVDAVVVDAGGALHATSGLLHGTARQAA